MTHTYVRMISSVRSKEMSFKREHFSASFVFVGQPSTFEMAPNTENVTIYIVVFSPNLLLDHARSKSVAES